MELVLNAIYKSGGYWPRALEPTCGAGSFVLGLKSLANPPREIHGIELQPKYVQHLRLALEQKPDAIRTRVTEGDLFRLNLAELSWSERGPLLVVGNPPWVTNAELSTLGSSNLPEKSNIKGLRGFDAMTGESNFDIAEYIWIKLIKELAWARATIALLCKTAVARNVLKFAAANGLPISGVEIRPIDAKKWFNAAADACLFRVDIANSQANYDAAMYKGLEDLQPHSSMGHSNGSLVSNKESYEKFSYLEGDSEFEWRQGVKHDLADVMDLREVEGQLRNKSSEIVDVEPEFVYGLLKSSDLYNQDDPNPRYRVPITQKQLGEDTSLLATSAPKLWDYLNSNKLKFDARKSSIYRDRPAFSMFGIGEYSFAPYKVAVSGLYKTIRFRVVRPWNGKPTMLDDTCYFIPCESLSLACALCALLNSPEVLSFLDAIVFKDSKRPVTKKVLQRLSIKALLSQGEGGQLLGCVNSLLATRNQVTLEDSYELESLLFPIQKKQAQKEMVWSEASR